MVDASYQCFTAGSSWSEPLVAMAGPSLAWTGPKQVLIDVTAVAITRLDTENCAQNMGKQQNAVMGTVGIGHAVAMTDDVTGLRLGGAYGFVTLEGGAYSERRKLPVSSLVSLPDGVTHTAAAALLLPALTARYLTLRTYRVFPEAPVIIRGVTGSVGRMVAHFVHQLGGYGIGIVKHADHIARTKTLPLKGVVVDGDAEGLTKILASHGPGAVVAYDFVGGPRAHDLLDALAPLGLFVSAGQVDGAPPSFDPALLGPRSLFYTRPSLHHHLQPRIEQLLAHLDVFGMIQQQLLTMDPPVVWTWNRLSEAMKAVHERHHSALVCQRHST